MVKKICKYDYAEHNAVLLSKIDNGDSQYQLGFNAGMLKGKRVGAKQELERLIHYDSKMDISLGIDAVEFIAKRLMELKK